MFILTRSERVERKSRRNFLLFCIGLFTIASFACGAAISLGMILVARGVQGAGAGALQPLSQAILLESFPPAKRGVAMALFGLGVVVAPVLGPTLGGWLTDQYTWRWAFYINLPVGILAMFMIYRFVKDPPYIEHAKAGRIDSIGLGLLAIWLAALQIILDKGQEDDWFGATWIRWAFAILIAAFVAFLIRQLMARGPLVRLRVFKDTNFAFGCLLIALFGGVIYAIVTILPLFYQTVMGYMASAAGIAVSPRGLGAIFVMPIIGVLTSKIDNRWLIAAGFLLIARASYAIRLGLRVICFCLPNRRKSRFVIGVDAFSRTFHGYVEGMPGATGSVMSLLPPENATGNFVGATTTGAYSA